MKIIKKFLKNLRKKSTVIILVASAMMVAFGLLFAAPLAKIFVGYDTELLELTQRAFSLYSISFLFIGFNIFASSFFTALNNGVISALLSFLRLFLFEAVSVLCLPFILGIDGIWLSVVFAEGFALILSIFCVFTFRKKYRY